MAPPRRATSQQLQDVSAPTFLERSSADPASSEPATANAGSRAAPPAPASRKAASPWVLVARLVRPHGRRGELVAEILTDFPERFHQRPRLFLIPPERVGTRPREVRLENFWFQRSRIVLKLEGVDSINEAETLRGYQVAIPASERAPLEPGAVYVSDLIGCTVVDLNRGGAEVGQITDLERGSSSTDLLIVRRRNVRGREIMIPLVKEYWIRIDEDARRVEMRLPEGLLEINDPLTDEEKRQMSGKAE